jgi:hypothetical protein
MPWKWPCWILAQSTSSWFASTCSWLLAIESAFGFRCRSQTTLTRFGLFLTTYPPPLTFFMVWTLTKVDIFGPPTYLPRLVNVVIERPLSSKSWVYLCWSALSSTSIQEFFGLLFGIFYQWSWWKPSGSFPGMYYISPINFEGHVKWKI